MISKKCFVYILGAAFVATFFLLVTSSGIATAQEVGAFEPADCWFDKPIPFVPGPEYECGYVTVPERHENPDSPVIQLPVAISRAPVETAKPDPLILAQGGPGGDAFEVFSILLGASTIPQERDIVIFNQRGTKYAKPDLSCTESFDGMAEVLALPADEGEALSLQFLQACYDRLAAEGIDLSAYNSLQNAADVNAIRQALGYDEYNFYGVSYGTLLGMHLIQGHQDGLRSVILDGVVPPNLNFIPRVTANTDRIFTEIIETCERSPECNRQYPNLEQRFFDQVDRLNDSPTTVTLRNSKTGERVMARLDGDTLVDVLFQAFYLPDSYAYFPKLVSNLEAGDMTFVEGIWPLFAFDESISEGMYFSVVCSEDADFSADELELDGVRPYFAAGARADLDSYSDACAIWEVEQLPDSVDDPVVSDIPTLLLSGRYDPITPPSFAEVAAEGLSSNNNLVNPTGSHGVAFGDLCMDRIMNQFLDTPRGTIDASCLADIERKDFAPIDAISFPLIGEINQLSDTVWWQFGLGALFLLIVLSVFLVLPVAWLIRVFGSKDSSPEEKTEKRLRWTAGLTAFAFGILALIFVAGATYYTFESIFSGLATVFAVSRAAAPFFVIPMILTVLSLAMLIVAVLAWQRGYWHRWARVYFTIVTAAALAYVATLSYGGMLTVLL